MDFSGNQYSCKLICHQLTYFLATTLNVTILYPVYFEGGHIFHNLVGCFSAFYNSICVLIIAG